MARYPGDEFIPQPKIVDGRVCQKIDLRYLGPIVGPELAKKAFAAAGIWIYQTTSDIFWVEAINYEAAHRALNIAMDPEGSRDRIEFLKEALPETADEYEAVLDIYEKIHGEAI